jgi:hypothetical protein
MNMEESVCIGDGLAVGKNKKASFGSVKCKEVKVNNIGVE